MNTFTASNGIRVYLDDDGDLDIDNHGRVGLCGGPVLEALREFFRAEEDERLNRWRFPDDPDFVVYGEKPRFGAHTVRVFRESTAQAIRFSRNEHISSQPSQFGAAALAFLDAHPEPKPWHEAKPGEVWLVTFEGETRAMLVDPDQFTDMNEGIDIDYAGITDARRIYPEVAS